MSQAKDQAPGALTPEQAPISVTETPSDPDYYFKQFGNDLQTSYWDSLKAAATEGFSNMPTIGISRSNQLDDLEKAAPGPKVSPNELNRKYPEMDTPFTESTNWLVADEMARRARDRHELASIIDRGPQGGLYGVGRFAAGFAGGALDPLNLGAALATGFAAEAVGLTEGLASASMGRYAATRFGEGVVGSAVPEALSAHAAVKEGQNYGVGDYVSNVLMSGAGYAGISTGLKFGAPKIAEFFGRTPKVDEAAKSSATAQLATDRQVDVQPLAKDMTKEANGSAQIPADRVSSVRDYHYDPIMESDQVRDRAFYHGAGDSMGNFKEVPKGPIEENFGHGVYLTDNPVVANAHAASTFADANGKIFKVGVDKADLNLINLDKNVQHGPVRDIIEGYLDEQKNRKPGELTDGGEKAVVARGKTPAAPNPFEGGATAKEALSRVQDMIREGRLPADALDEIASRLKSAGFDGYVHEGGEFMGESNAPHNIMQLFDPEKTGDAGGIAQETGQFQPDREMVKPPSAISYEDLAREKASPENHIDHDPQAAQELEEMTKRPPKVIDLPDLEEHENEALKELQRLHEAGQLHPEEAKAMERLQEMEKEAQDEQKIIKEGSACLGREI